MAAASFLCAEMSERETVLSAIEAVILLNEEAGVNNESLALVRAVSEGRQKVDFDLFCKDIMTCIHGCFCHFTRVLPHLAKERAHRDFHQARLKSIPAIWLSFTSAAGLQIEPLNLQAVSRHIFDGCMRKFFQMLQAPVENPWNTDSNTHFLADEENVLRYSSGYVGLKLLKQLRKAKGAKAAQYRECLSSMSRHGDDSSFLAYTTEWINAVNRGGLFLVNDTTFELFKAIEGKTRELLPRELAQTAKSKKKDEIVEAIARDETVQLKWGPVGIDIIDVEHSNELLGKIVGIWVSIRGFAITSNWMEEYKRAKDKSVKKSKGLRTELKMAAS